jgi:hypothetical protein
LLEEAITNLAQIAEWSAIGNTCEFEEAMHQVTPTELEIFFLDALCESWDLSQVR